MTHHPTLHMALAVAQAEFPPLKRDAEGQIQSRKYDYITLDEIVAKCTPVLTENGLCLSHQLIHPNVEGPSNVLTTLTHVWSGDCVTSSCEMLVGSDGNPMQQMGSAETYAMRYNTKALLNIAVDTDDDGEAPSAKGKTQSQGGARTYSGKKVSEKQLAYMGRLMDELGYSDTKRMDIVRKVTKGKSDNAAEMTTGQAGACIDRLKEIKEEHKAKAKKDEAPDPNQDQMSLDEPPPSDEEPPDDIPMN